MKTLSCGHKVEAVVRIESDHSELYKYAGLYCPVCLRRELRRKLQDDPTDRGVAVSTPEERTTPAPEDGASD